MFGHGLADQAVEFAVEIRPAPFARARIHVEGIEGVPGLLRDGIAVRSVVVGVHLVGIAEGSIAIELNVNESRRRIGKPHPPEVERGVAGLCGEPGAETVIGFLVELSAARRKRFEALRNGSPQCFRILLAKYDRE